MSLMSGLYVGQSGLQTSSNALNTVAHNLSNVDTTGYTRQTASLSTRHYNPVAGTASTVYQAEVGLGVRYAEARQVRDFFLDKTYRRESGRSAFYEVSYDTLIQLEDLLGESGEENFQESISDFWKTIQELANDPSSAVTQGLFVSKAQTLIERATNVYNSICDYQNNLNNQVVSYVNQLNEYGERLKELNDQIVTIETGGVEHANDLRDERNFILDKMSELAFISYSEDVDGYVSVQIEGTDFVKRDNFYPMDVVQNENGFYVPFWPQNAKSVEGANGEKIYTYESTLNAQVFDLSREISTDLNTDIGKLKSVLLARGDHNATASDLKDEATYNSEIAQSICMNVEAEFDAMISNIVQVVNNILEQAGYLDEDGKGLFVYIAPADVDENGNEIGSPWHLGNIEVNDNFLQKPTLLKMMKEDGSVDYDTAEKLKSAFNEESYHLNPNITKKTNFIGFYSDLVTQVSNTGSIYQSIYENQQITVSEASSAREQIVGVSSDEELQYMIMYQNAYNASSRYINTVNDMLQNMLNAFGA